MNTDTDDGVDAGQKKKVVKKNKAMRRRVIIKWMKKIIMLCY